MSYDHKKIDAKWQERWDETGVFNAKTGGDQEKFYVLVEFPYPSGAGLHVGHPRSYTALDIVARKKRMEGKNVLFPMGWDAFGLPAENYAIKTGVHPSIVTKQNIDTFRKQLKAIGFSFDWSREVDTTDPKYYRWTQWMFNQFFKAGLAYKAKAFINWCPKDKIGLANEEVIGGCCERCGTPVEKREKEQWMIAITKYADRLISDLDTVNYLPKIKKQQEDWIGRSEGAEIDFELNFTFTPEANNNRGPNGEKAKLTVFTTRPDTIFGATYLVLAPEHLWVTLATDDDHHVLENKDEVKAYVEGVKSKTEIDRTNEDKEKTGVELKGVKAINPATGEEIPMFVADYVLPQYGTGAIMAVPAHDERDFAFAKKYELPIRQVVAPEIVLTGDRAPRQDKDTKERPVVSVIIKHAKTGKFLVLKINDGHCMFVGGGVETGEDVRTAALREVTEETGFTNVTLRDEPIVELYGHGFKAKKGHNCYDFDTVFFAEVDGEQVALSEDDKHLHELEWCDEHEVRERLSVAHHKYMWEVYRMGNHCFTGEGVAVHSGQFNGKKTADVKREITSLLEEKGAGRAKVTYKLRDWVFSRQRYWGEPIPLVHCEKCDWVAVPDDQLPVELPQVEKYQPTDTGESPLAAIDEWVNTTCPNCGGPAKRETDTMPNWAGSSWYFLRYVDPHNDEVFASKEALKYWMPVDLYNGGMEHTTLHLLYSRFWNKFLFDQGFVPTSEPYARRHSHGLIMAEDGTKMSKSKGNVVNPDDVVAEFGADAFRTYIVFMGPFEEPVPWSINGLVGVRRFLEKVERMVLSWKEEREAINKFGALEFLVNSHGKNQFSGNPEQFSAQKVERAIHFVSSAIDDFRFNVAVAELMKVVNSIIFHQKEWSETREQVQSNRGIPFMSEESLKRLLIILSPFAPHLVNELWESVGFEGMADIADWPEAKREMLIESEITIVVQVNGKVRANLVVPADIADADLIALAKADERVQKYLTGEPKKEIVVKGKLVNLVV